MKLKNPLAASRGVRPTFGRIANILYRFGLTSRKMEDRLNKYVEITEKFSCSPTFAVTAVTLKRHPNLMKDLSKKGVELAVHGHVHADHKLLSLEEQMNHFQKASAAFEMHGIPFKGFRAPYLRTSSSTLEALIRLKFAYDSSQTIQWPVIEESKYSRRRLGEYNRLLDFYQPSDAATHLSLPHSINGLLEIPVSIPDDEALVERIGITKEQKIAEIWEKMFERTYASGELLVLQLHPERIIFCASALGSILEKAREAKPPVWIARLGEIAQWWKQRDKFNFEINNEGNGQWRVRADCTDKGTVLMRNCKANVLTTDWADGYKSIDARDFILESHVCPCIGVSPNSSEEAIGFLKGEGFVVKIGAQPGNCGMYFDSLASFNQSDEKQISEAIERSNAPLIRFWRWGGKAKSALAISGDIDAITLADFAMRLIEVRR
jgi:hypothetical protein